jgi:phage baseplate assembly protein W
MIEIPNAHLGVDLLVEDGDLVIASNGDLAVTTSGRTTLLQDVRNLLDTLPGDLFAHPSYGAGVSRLFGAEDVPNYTSLIIRAITDALTYDPAVAPRIEPESITVTTDSGTAGDIPRPRASAGERTFYISFQPIGEEGSSRLNLVWPVEPDITFT